MFIEFVTWCRGPYYHHHRGVLPYVSVDGAGLYPVINILQCLPAVHNDCTTGVSVYLSIVSNKVFFFPSVSVSSARDVRFIAGFLFVKVYFQVGLL